MRIEMKMMKNFILAAILVASFAGFAVQAQAQAQASQPHPEHRAERWPLRTDGGWRALSDAGHADQQLQRLAGHAAAGVARRRGPARQYGRDAHLLGAVRAQAGAVRHHADRHGPGPGARAPPSPGAALVRHMEERQPALHARVDEARARKVLPRRQQARRAGRLALALCPGVARRRHPRIHRVHEAPEDRRPSAHSAHGSGRERDRHMGDPARLLAAGGEALRRAGARRCSEGDERVARIAHCELAGCLRHGGRGELPRMGHCSLRWPDRRRGQGGLPAAALCQRRAARSHQARRARQLRVGRPHRQCA